MRGLGSTSGMGKLFVDGLNVGAVFYEVAGQTPGAAVAFDARISGDPAALRQAYKEGNAVLVLKDGRRLPITVVRLEQEDQVGLLGWRRAECRSSA